MILRSPDEQEIQRLRAQPVLSASEAATLARCGRRAVYSWIRRGVIPAVKAGPWFRIPTRPFLAYLEHGDATLIEEN